MPARQGFYSGTGQRIGEGVFTAMRDLGERLQTKQDQEKASRRTLLDRVIKGEMEPAQAEKALGAQGVTVPKGYFSSFQPTEDDRTASALAPTLAAKIPQEVQTTEAANLGLRRRGLNPIAEYEGPTQSGGSVYQGNPEASSILESVRSQMAGLQKPEVTSEGMTGEGPDATPTKQYTRFGLYPGQPAISNVGPPQMAGPSAGQKGAFTGAEDIAAAPGKGQAAAQVERLQRPEKVESERQGTQARLQEEYSPEMLALRTRLAASEESARQDAQAARVDYNNGRDETSTGLPYVNLDKFQGNDARYAAQAVARANAKAATSGGSQLALVKGPEAELLKQGDQVRLSLQTVADLIPKLPPNILGLPLVELQRRAQSDPQLAGVLSSLQPAALGTARVMAGTTGFRSNRIEMERAIDAYLTATTAETKIVQLTTINKLLTNEEALHLLPSAKDRSDYMKAQTTPAPVPLQQGQRAYRFGKSTYIFNRDGSLAGTFAPAAGGR